MNTTLIRSYEKYSVYHKNVLELLEMYCYRKGAFFQTKRVNIFLFSQDSVHKMKQHDVHKLTLLPFSVTFLDSFAVEKDISPYQPACNLTGFVAIYKPLEQFPYFTNIKAVYINRIAVACQGSNIYALIFWDTAV